MNTNTKGPKRKDSSGNRVEFVRLRTLKVKS